MKVLYRPTPQSVYPALPPLQLDPSAVVRLRKRLGRAATSLKVIGLLSTFYIFACLMEYIKYTGAGVANTGAGVATICSLLVLWCACRIAEQLRSGSTRAAALAAAWGLLWTAVPLSALSKGLKNGIDVGFLIGMVMFSAPLYFLARGLFAFVAQRALQASAPNSANPLASSPWELDVSPVVRLRKRLGRAATSLKIIGLLSAFYVFTYSYLYVFTYLNGYVGVGAALACGLLVLWCACRIAAQLRSGSTRAAALGAAWGVLWTAIVLLDGLPKGLKDGIDVVFLIGMVMFSAPLYFLARGLFAFIAQRALQASAPNSADPLASNPWEEGFCLKTHPKFMNKKSIAAYWFFVLSPLLYVTVSRVTYSPPDPNDEVRIAGYGMCGVLLILAMWTWGARNYGRARRAARLTGSEFAKQDARAIVLYLRSFQDDSEIKLYARGTDGRILLERLVKITLEELVTDHLWGYGPVLAIGDSQVKGNAPTLGAVRDYDPSWQENVTDLIQRASMIVAIVGATHGLFWEIDKVMSLGLRWKLVLLLPPVPIWELRWRWQCLTSNVIGADLPTEIDLRRTRAVVFEDGRPALITADQRNDWTYEAVLDKAALMIASKRNA
jgi:hypothetical protein